MMETGAANNSTFKVAHSKLPTHFSIENILRKEENRSKHRSTSSYSEISVHEEDRCTSELWKRDYDYTRRVPRDELPVLENRHRLTEHWVYENHFQQPTNLPVLRSNHYHSKNLPYTSPIDADLIPSPSPTPEWSTRFSGHQTKKQSLEYWFLDRMMRNYSNTGVNGYPTNRRTHPSALRCYWNSTGREERDSFHGFFSGSPRSKSMLHVDDDDSDEGNRKGGQVRFSHTQSTELERVFSLQKYVSPQERKQLARSIDLSERQVKTWFQNRRAKWRRIKLEDEMRYRMTDANRIESNLSSKLDNNLDNNKNSSPSDINSRQHIDYIESVAPPPTQQNFRTSESNFTLSDTEFRLAEPSDFRKPESDFRSDFCVREESHVCS